MCLNVFLLGFIMAGTLCASWTWLTISFHILVKFSAINYFLRSFLFFPSGPPKIQMLACFYVVPETVFVSFHYFFYILGH